ncbi:MAG: hypothetical protein IPK75_02655 [Acidobacteria bacterium]|jgi:ABC-type xylose transport system permease subunit|nr:hypothetical protein [Acidobacteriota bacterium]
MTGRFFDPSEIARAYRDPLSWVSFGVDLLPVIAVFAFGWGAVPLVALYWLENLVIGVFTILRMLGTVAANAANIFGALFMVPFFTVHYGGFCYGHGVFLAVFAGKDDFPSPDGLVRWALTTAPEMGWFVAAIAGVSLLYYIFDFFGRGEYRRTSLDAEMAAPYGRIVTLHVAIILGAGIAFGLGQPLLGVLLLIVIRVVFGIVFTVLRRRRRDALIAAKASVVDDDA